MTMLLYTKTKDGYRIIATSQGVMVTGPTEELANKLLDRINRSNGKYWLYPDKIVFYDDDETTIQEHIQKQNKEYNQNQKTSFWKKLFGN